MSLAGAMLLVFRRRHLSIPAGAIESLDAYEMTHEGGRLSIPAGAIESLELLEAGRRGAPFNTSRCD